MRPPFRLLGALALAFAPGLRAAFPARAANARPTGNASRVVAAIRKQPALAARFGINLKPGCRLRRSLSRSELVLLAAALPTAERFELLGHLTDSAWLAGAGLLIPTSSVPGCGCTANVPPGGAADIGVTKSASPTSLVAGNPVAYPITLKNYGTATSGAITLTDALPAPLAFVSVTPGAPTCAAAGNTVTCALTGLASGASTLVTVNAAVPVDAASATVNNTATAALGGDNNPGNNSGSAGLIITASYPGRVPDNSLRIAKHAATSDLDLSWFPGCGTAITGYAVYEGTLGNFTSHVPFNSACSVASTSLTGQTPGSGNRFYLVVPRSAGEEGSLGADSAGAEFPASATPCVAARDLTASCQ